MRVEKHYVLDSCFFVLTRNYYPEIFPSFWEKMGIVVKGGTILSVRESLREIKKYGGEQQHLLDWVNQNESIFDFLKEAEQKKITEIMTRFPSFRSEKKPWADPSIIARAWVEEATVVTTEKTAKDDNGNIPPNPHKIPDICEILKVKCINPQQFMKEHGWKF